MKNLQFFAGKWFVLFLLLASSFSLVYGKNKGLVLTRPADGAVIADNMPELTWLSVEGCTYEVWIDGIKQGSEISQNWFIPFPLSYGTHQWQVKAAWKCEDSGTMNTYEITVENEGESIALMIQFKPVNEVSGLEVLPSVPIIFYRCFRGRAEPSGLMCSPITSRRMSGWNTKHLL